MIKTEELKPGDIVFSDGHPQRSVLIVHVQQYDGTMYFPDGLSTLEEAFELLGWDDWLWAIWWLDVTSENGFKMLSNSSPIGPWQCPDQIPFHRERSERNVHDADGNPESDSAAF